MANINSKSKGKRGELELARKLREHGYDCRRSQQYAGINGDADLVGLPHIHIECKRVERLNIYDAVAQAKRDAKDGYKPTVFHRKNNCEWLVTMTLDDWIELYREYEMGFELNEVFNMCRNCYNCDSFIPKSKQAPFNAFDYIPGNKIGVCNETEHVTPLLKVIDNCDMWSLKENM